MLVSELIATLQTVQAEHGDIVVAIYQDGLGGCHVWNTDVVNELSVTWFNDPKRNYLGKAFLLE